MDVDLACDLPHSIMVERDSHGFPMDIIYENLQPKCSNCGVVGHLFVNCRYVRKVDDQRGRSPSRTGRSKAISKSHFRQKYRPIHDMATLDLNNGKLDAVAMADHAIDAAINH